MGLINFTPKGYPSIYERPDREFTGEMVDESTIINRRQIDINSVPRSKAFEECMTYFNVQNDLTRKVLLTVNEADQQLVMQSLANRLYTHITDKVDDIDFGSIPNTRGDITKLDNYTKLRDCLDVLSQILQNYNQSVYPVETVIVALDNLVDRKDMFMKAYRINAQMPIITYNTMALSVVSATSLLISTHIEFIKLPGDAGYDIAFDKASKIKSREKILFTNLESFNKMCSSGEFDKAMNFTMTSNVIQQAKKESALMTEDVFGAAAGLVAGHPGVIGVVGVILLIIFIVKVVRNLIFYFYYFRTKLSDYFDMQSSLLYMNAANIENNLTKDPNQKKQISGKQKRIADAMKRLSNTLAVKDRTAEQKASQDIKKVDSQKYDIQDVTPVIPDSANAVLF